MKALIKRSLSWSALALLSACGVVDQYGERAVSYNREARQAQDAGLLLNIVRAQHRHPLQFTAVTGITGNASATGQFAMTVPIGVEATRAYTAVPSASASGSSQFQVTVLDTEEFIKGILQPIDIITVDYYLHQQFPRDVLYHLLFERIDVVAPDGKILKTYDNFPEGRRFPEFQTFAKHLYTAHLTTETVSNATKIGPVLSASELKNPDHLVKIAQAGLKLQPIDDNRTSFQLQKDTKIIRMCFKRDGDPLPDFDVPEAAYCGNSIRQRDEVTRKLAQSTQANVAFSLPALVPKGTETRTLSDSSASYIIYPRSTEGVIYYLGEVVRRQLAKPDNISNAGKMVTVNTGDGENDLFVVHQGIVAPSLAQVTYMGQTYSIAANAPRTRTTQVLSLVTQLISQNKSAKDLPATNVFTLVGR